MTHTLKYEGWTFKVVPARLERAEDVLHPESTQEEIDQWNADYPDGLVESCDYADREGWGIELVVADKQSDEIIRTSICYPESEHLFETDKEAIRYIQDGFAYLDAMHSILGDNLDNFRRLK